MKQIGGFGEGSTAILDRRTEKILIHDCADAVPLEEVADRFTALLQQQVGNIIKYAANQKAY